jgi:hypothetical protein
MTPKKIMLTGIDAATNEESIRAWLGYFGPVLRVDIIREGDLDYPLALVEMDIGDGAAASLMFRLSDYWHEGKLVKAWLLHH